MSTEYNSQLISKLYTTTDEDELIAEVLNEMEEIGDPVFIYPIFDAYNKYKNDSIGHYFISALGYIKSKDSEKILNTLLQNLDNLNIRYWAWVLNSLDRLGYYTETASETAVSIISSYNNESFKRQFNKIDTEYILGYLKRANKLQNVEERLKEMLFHDFIKSDEKKIILTHYIKINPNKNIKYFLDNYQNISKTPLELLLAKELTHWEGGSVSTLKELIIKKGQNRASEILKKEREEVEKDQKKKKTEEIEQSTNIHGNLIIVQEILQIRKDINRISSTKFKFPILYDCELFLEQTQSANDESSLIYAASNLRSIIKKINPKVSRHGLDDATISVLLPHSEDKDKRLPLNQLFLFLHSKKLSVDSGLFDLKKLNHLLSLMVHPENNDDLIKEYKKNKLENLYTSKKWSKIHEKILSQYKESLKQLKAIME